MATRFRALAAPVDASTGDQRRFAEGGITNQPLPMPGRWVREDVGAHDGAVTVASLTDVEMVGDQIWVTGHWYDDVDPAKLPRLAQDVAEAMHLAREGVLGFSVDLDDFEVAFVRPGTDEPLPEEELFDSDGQVEALITKGRIRSATLVAIPAYVETNHTIQFLDATEDDEAVSEPDDAGDEDVPELALVASAGDVFPVEAFVAPVEVDRLMPITYDWERGVAYGHVAPWNVCHAGVPDACILAPRDQGDYRDFHTHRVPTSDGVIYAGRITAGGVHPAVSDDITAHTVRQHHDAMTTVAYVRAHEDAFGIFVCGPLVGDLDEATREVLSRRKVSADWRETDAGLSMIEVLALGPGPRAVSEPGFPVRASFAGGRQIALVASLVPAPGEPPAVEEEHAATRPFENFSLTEIVRDTYRVIKTEEAAEARRHLDAAQARGELSAALAAEARANLARALGV